ncbi:hypothetical protein [Vibrio mexicanus]|uniref:hypothetical protein n=1 Tax=Vibrio mexicanus TaxID=1004326 RepID=UPI000699796B|nr:hypothetical protein [Vibrio mexicanus]
MSLEKFIIASELVTPSGMNSSISMSVAKAELSRFASQTCPTTDKKYACASIDFIKADSLEEKWVEVTNLLLDSLLQQIPPSLKPIPMLITLPQSVKENEFNEKFATSGNSNLISHYEVIHCDSGPALVEQAIKSLDRHDAVLVVGLDSLFEARLGLLEAGEVLTSGVPWGVVPSEGGAGVILARRNLVETLKLNHEAKFNYFSVDYSGSSRQALMSLVRNASRNMAHLGRIYTNKTNSRSHTEDYSFALGARAEKFAAPQQPLAIDKLWGTMGKCSSLALMCVFASQDSDKEGTTLMMFDQGFHRGLLFIEY